MMIALQLLLLLGAAFASVQAQVFNCVGGSLYSVAHADDSLLFASPALLSDIAQGCCTTLVLTAGDSGAGTEYAQSRESGLEAATAQMAGKADDWTEFNATFGGQPCLVRTLAGSSGIQIVYFRLPDGAMDGEGYAVTGYQSLRALYFGTITTLYNQPRTASYTIATLRQAIAQILTARKPARIRTLDHLSDFDAGDHSDHLTTGRITSDLMSTYAPQATEFGGYMGYPVAALPPTLATTSAEYQAKTTAFFAYTPYDPQECQNMQDCRNQGRGEVSWLQRQYAVTPALRTTSTIGAGTQPVTLPPGNNVAGLSKATASSVDPASPVKAAIDGVLGGYPGNESAEWSSSGGGVGTWLKLTWTTPVNISGIVLYDRPNRVDWLQAGTLTTIGGVKVPFSITTNDGTASIVTLPANTFLITTTLLLTVTKVADGTENVGLSEIVVLGVTCAGCTATKTTTTTKPPSSTSTSRSSTSTSLSASTTRSSTSASTSSSSSSATSSTDGPAPTGNLALLASAVASTESPNQGAGKAIDGVVNGYKEDGSGSFSNEWASDHQTAGAKLTLTWSSPITASRVVLFDRPNLNDQVTSLSILFGGVTTSFGALSNDGSGNSIALSGGAATGSSMVITVLSASSSTSNIGLAEVQVYASAATASTTTSSASSSTTTSSSSSLMSSSTTSSTSSSTTSSTSSSATSSSATPSSTNFARLATASASSQAPNQGPEKAIDGVKSGYKEDGSGNFANEWASDHETAGAKLSLTWSSPITASSVTLYDRPNLNDQVLSGTIAFGGVTTSFGALTNDGSGNTFSLSGGAATGSSMVVTLLSSSGSTSNVGLSEVEVR